MWLQLHRLSRPCQHTATWIVTHHPKPQPEVSATLHPCELGGCGELCCWLAVMFLRMSQACMMQLNVLPLSLLLSHTGQGAGTWDAELHRLHWHCLLDPHIVVKGSGCCTPTHTSQLHLCLFTLLLAGDSGLCACCPPVKGFVDLAERKTMRVQSAWLTWFLAFHTRVAESISTHMLARM